MNKAKAMQILAIRLQNRQDSIFNDEMDSDRRAYPFFFTSILLNIILNS